MVTIDFFSAGSLWSLEFCRTKNEQFWANLEVIFKNCHHFTHKSVQKCNFGFYSITGNYTNEIRLKVCQKSNISEENTVANFGFNCKNGNFSPILRLYAITRGSVNSFGLDGPKTTKKTWLKPFYLSCKHAKQCRKHFLNFRNKRLKHYKIWLLKTLRSQYWYIDGAKCNAINHIGSPAAAEEKGYRFTDY